MIRGCWAPIVLLVLSASCSPKSAAPSGVGPPRDEGAVAQVGRTSLFIDNIERIAKAQGVPVREALDLSISDALFAEEAEAREIPAPLYLQDVEGLLRLLGEQTRASGPPTDEEVNRMTEHSWLAVNRPPSVAVVHAVVRLAEDASPQQVATAEDLARELEAKARSIAADADRFEPVDLFPKPGVRRDDDPLASAIIAGLQLVDRRTFEVVVEQLPPLGNDGLTVELAGRQRFDPKFVAAAMRLTRRGEVLGSVRTSFGVHVLVALDRSGGVSLPLEERRARFAREIYAGRARVEMTALLSELREKTPVEVDPSSENLLALPRFSP